VVDRLRTRLAEQLSANNLDGFILTSPENVFYASGIPTRHMEFNPVLFVVSNQYPSWIIVDGDGESTLVTWDLVLRDFEPTVSEVRGIRSLEEAVETVGAIIKEKGLGARHIGMEGRCPVFLYERLRKNFPEMTLETVDQIFLNLRRTKSADEIERMKNASRITSEVITSLFQGLRPEVTDRDLVISAKKAMLDKGAMGWDHLSLSMGTGTGLFPFRGYELKRGNLVGTDFGAIYGGYSSDMNRLCVLGRPSAELSGFYQDLIDIEDVCTREIKPGNNVSDIYGAAIESFKQKKLEPATNLFGHSIGIQTEENPLIKDKVSMVLEENMVMNFEIYCKTAEGQFVGIEDTFLLTRSGNERLTTADRRLFEA
jgi:Xaa-Pro aminopeptidase